MTFNVTIKTHGGDPMIHWSWLIVAFLLGWILKPSKEPETKSKYFRR